MPKRDIGGAVSRYSTVLKRANTQRPDEPWQNSRSSHRHHRDCASRQQDLRCAHQQLHVEIPSSDASSGCAAARSRSHPAGGGHLYGHEERVAVCGAKLTARVERRRTRWSDSSAICFTNYRRNVSRAGRCKHCLRAHPKHQKVPPCRSRPKNQPHQMRFKTRKRGVTNIQTIPGSIAP